MSQSGTSELNLGGRRFASGDCYCWVGPLMTFHTNPSPFAGRADAGPARQTFGSDDVLAVRGRA